VDVTRHLSLVTCLLKRRTPRTIDGSSEALVYQQGWWVVLRDQICKVFRADLLTCEGEEVLSWKSANSQATGEAGLALDSRLLALDFLPAEIL
jgi:hypothetical protein